ncbi:MAG TPA: sulfite exporter TauE/SafE family protein [Terriglobales bacterium]|nr:sulfite exporter TauE/SafE family protein [Terriglobales bacterium]
MFDPIVIYVVCIVFVATLIRSALGFGEALVAVPLLAICIPITVAAPLAVLISVLVAAVVLVQDWRRVELRSAAGLIFSSLPGIPAGVLLLTRGNEHIVKSILGVSIVGFSFYALTTRTTRRLSDNHYGWLLGCGLLSGILGGAYGMNGPPLAIYGALSGWSPQRFRATLQGYFLPASLVGLICYAAAGLWSPVLTHYFLLSLPAIAVAVLLGGAINQRMSGHDFTRLIYFSLIAVGSVLLTQAITR